MFPEVLSRTFGGARFDLRVLDTTDPAPSSVTSSAAGVFEQDTHGRRRGVIELPGTDGPGKRNQKRARDEAAGGNEQHDHAHASTWRVRHRIKPTLSPTIVSELAGIRMAAASGVRSPRSASVRPIAL